MPKNNYDKLAPFYDLISHSVYGQALVKAQRSVLPYILDGQNVLIVGGGTGWILNEIEKLGRKHISVTYIEASSKMVALARKRKVSFQVDFVCDYVEDVNTDKLFEVIITPFFFDNFQEEKCLFILDKLDKLLKSNGLFLYADFRLIEQNRKFWKKLVLKRMYLFFRIFTKIETNNLVDMATILDAKYELKWSQFSFHDFVFAAMFQKNLKK